MLSPIHAHCAKFVGLGRVGVAPEESLIRSHFDTMRPNGRRSSAPPLVLIVLTLFLFVRNLRSQQPDSDYFSCDILTRNGENEWIVDKAAVESVNYNVQTPVDCIPDGGSMLFDIDMLNPTGTVKLNKPIKIGYGGASESSKSNMILVTCPNEIPAFEISSRGVTLSDMDFEECSSNGSSIVDILPGSHVTISNSKFKSNSNSGGAACISAQEAALILKNSSFEENSGVDGGAVTVKDNSVLKILDTEFKDNSGWKGGAVKAIDSDVRVRSSTFTGNSAEEKGGAVHVEAREKEAGVDVHDSTFFNNTLKGEPKEDEEVAQMSGGGIVVDGIGSTCKIVDSYFTGNIAVGFGGGALFENAHTLVIAHSTFTDNVASTGGALVVKTPSEGVNTTVTITDVAFARNRADRGSVHKDGPYGGAVFVNNTAIFELRRSMFVDNSADLAGGALSLGHIGSGLINDSVFELNTAEFGAGIEIYRVTLNVTHTLFENNTARAAGGAIFDDDVPAEMETYVHIEQSEFCGNAAKTGGAVAVESGSVVVHKWTVLASVFEDNTACCGCNGTDGQRGGGAIFMTGTLSVYWIGRGSVFRNNCASRGGGIHAAVVLPGSEIDPVELTIEDTLFEGNSATGLDAGGITASERVRTNLLNVTFIANSGVEGGALYVPEISPTSIKACKFLDNHAELGGGAIYYEHIDDGGNEFLQYWNEPMFLLIQDSVFEDNVAGEALEVSSGHMVTSVFSGGGAIMVHGPGTNTTLQSVLIKNNGAGEGGCIMWKDGGILSVSDVEIFDNQAFVGGGMSAMIAPQSHRNLTMKRVRFSENEAHKGGGLAMEYDAPAFESLADAEYGADRVASLIDVTFNDNTATDEGGGAYFQAIYLQCHNCTFEHNSVGLAESEAIGKGGAVTIRRGAFGMLTGSSIRDNVADQGGGVYVLNAGVSLTEVEFVKNAARDIGGGVAFHYGAMATTKTSVLAKCVSCTMTRNNARLGGAAYIVAEAPRDFLEKCSILGHIDDFPLMNQQELLDLTNKCNGMADYKRHVEARHVVFEDSLLSSNTAEEAGAAIFASGSDILKICCENECIVGNKSAKALKNPCMGARSVGWKENRVTGKSQESVVSTPVDRIKLDPPEIRKHESGLLLPTIKAVFYDELDQIAFGQNVSLRVSVAKPNAADGKDNGDRHNVTLSGNPVRGVFLDDGANDVEGIKMTAKPGNYTLEFEFTIDLPGAKPKSIMLPVEIRRCRIGEKYVETRFICVACDAAQYGFQSTAGCASCPAYGLCNATTLVPTDGFWQATSQSTKIQRCVLKEACTFYNRTESLRQQAHDAHLHDGLLLWNTGDYWQCQSPGYDGPLCGSCEEGFGRMGSDECGRCPWRMTSVLMVVGAFAVLFLQTIFLTRQARGFARAMGELSSDSSSSSQSPQKKEEVRGVEKTLDEAELGGPSVTVERNDGDQSGQSSGDSRSEIEVSVAEDKPKEKEEKRMEFYDLRGERQLKFKFDRKTLIKMEANRTMEILKILINFLQVIGTAAGINSGWTKSVGKLLSAADVASVVSSDGSGMFSAECAFSEYSIPASILSSYFHLLSPFIIWFIFIFFWLVRRLRNKNTNAGLLTRFVTGLLVILYVSYIRLTKKAVEVYNCLSVHDSLTPTDYSYTRLWSADTDVECFEGYHALLTGLVASPIMLLIVLGYPLGLIFELRANKSRLNDRDFAEKYGFLYKAYREGATFWEALVLMRKGLLATIVVFSSRLDPTFQGTLASLVLAAALLLHNIFRPYDRLLSRLNLLETWSLTICQFTFLCGLIFYQTSIGPHWVHVLLSVGVVGGVVSFVLYMLYELGKSGMEMLEKWVDRQGVDRQGSLLKDVHVVVKEQVSELKLWASMRIEKGWSSRKLGLSANGHGQTHA